MYRAGGIALIRELILKVVSVALCLREHQDEPGRLKIVQGADQHVELLVLLYELHLCERTSESKRNPQTNDGKVDLSNEADIKLATDDAWMAFGPTKYFDIASL